MKDYSSRTVACVVPCFRYAKYLEECIDSVVNQTRKFDEIFIVNDGSPDDTSEVARRIIEKYPSEPIILIEKENGGLSSARNRAIEAARSEFIQCIDADDKVLPESLERHMELVLDDMTLAQCALMEFGERHIMYSPAPTTSLERVMQSNTIFCNAVFSKRMWKEAGGFDESDTIRLGYEDWEFWIRMLAAGCYVRRSDYIALRYRAHSGNMTKETAHPNRQKLYRYIYDKHRALYNAHNITISGLSPEE